MASVCNTGLSGLRAATATAIPSWRKSRAQLALATDHLLNGQAYQVLKALRTLLPREERLLATRRQ